MNTESVYLFIKRTGTQIFIAISNQKKGEGHLLSVQVLKVFFLHIGTALSRKPRVLVSVLFCRLLFDSAALSRVDLFEPPLVQWEPGAEQQQQLGDQVQNTNR